MIGAVGTANNDRAMMFFSNFYHFKCGLSHGRQTHFCEVVEPVIIDHLVAGLLFFDLVFEGKGIAS